MSQGSNSLALKSGFGAEAQGPAMVSVQGGCYAPLPKIFSPTGDAPTKAAETWQQSGPSPQGFICLSVCLEVFLGGVLRACVLMPVGGGMQTSCLAGLRRINTPCMSHSKDLEPESQASTVGSTDPKWAHFRELPQSALCAGWLGGQRRGCPLDWACPSNLRRDQPPLWPQPSHLYDEMGRQE